MKNGDTVGVGHLRQDKAAIREVKAILKSEFGFEVGEGE